MIVHGRWYNRVRAFEGLRECFYLMSRFTPATDSITINILNEGSCSHVLAPPDICAEQSSITEPLISKMILQPSGERCAVPSVVSPSLQTRNIKARRLSRKPRKLSLHKQVPCDIYSGVISTTRYGCKEGQNGIYDEKHDMPYLTPRGWEMSVMKVKGLHLQV